ncbi:uncharacterised protein [Saccharolobus solfataricus]|uniref:Uncharacterized protein ORF-c10_023 n=1 Tax=Saccharolobus solfataricus TaxID=2287 RepID=Q9UX96_SACSO|nr:hypothetical protein [Saccharolobus solfataricus P2]SAI84288.1 uncharacterised protein [Saccharolobus solfataricus]
MFRRFKRYHISYTTNVARLAIFGHLSAASLAIGPLTSVPFGVPSGFIITTALSSKEIHVPSGLLYGILCLTITALNFCFLTSGVPFLIDTITISAMLANGTLLKTPL